MQLENPLNRNIFFYADVSQDTIGEVTQMLIEIETHDKRLAKMSQPLGMSYKPEPIIMYVNSFGGDVYACLGLIAVMQKCTTPIHTYVTGCAMSAGFMLAINGHKRFCYSTSTYMVHQLSNVSWGSIQERDERMVEDRRLQELLNENILTNTSLSKKDLKAIYKAKEDMYISAERAFKLGIVDEIV